MLAKLLTYLKHEEQLLKELVVLAAKQQKALIKYNIPELEQIGTYQEELSKNLREAEEQRIRLLMIWLKLPRKKASNLWLSSIERLVNSDELSELRNMRKILKKQILLLQNINTTNRILANRAVNSISHIVSIFTNGSSYVCNVRV